MSGICGWVNYNQSLSDNTTLYKMSNALCRNGNSSSKEFTDTRLSISLSSLYKNGNFYSGNDGSVAVIGDLRFTNGLQLTSNNSGAAKALLSGFTNTKDFSLEHIRGQFSAVVYLPKQKRTILITDKTGSHPLYYFIKNSTLVFASSVGALKKHPGFDNTLNNQAIYNYLYFHSVPGPSNIYKNVQKLDAGSQLIFDQQKEVTTPYWRPTYFSEFKRVNENLLIENLNNLLRSSITETLESKNVGTFLSGGIDSSTVTGIASELSDSKINAFSIGFDEPGYDEMEYARIAANHFNVSHHEYYVTPEDVVSLIPKIAETYAEPFGNSSAIPAYYCAKLAKDNDIQLMLAGDGGDELFGGNERYATQYLLSLYNNLPSSIRKYLLEPSLNAFPFKQNISPIRKLVSYVEQANIPMPDRLNTYNLLTKLNPKTICHPEFLDSINTGSPIEQIRHTYYESAAKTILNRQLNVDFKFTLTESDLPKVNTMCELAGVNVHYPLLDDRLIEFSNSLPATLKLKRTKLRYFFKKSQQGFLPDQILTKSKHGFGLPFGNWMQSHKPLRDLACSSLMSLKSRNIIRPDFLDKLTKHYINEHAAYYGTLIWVLMMLELWFQKHNDN